MRNAAGWIATVFVSALALGCRHEAGPRPSPTEIQGTQGIQAATDAYLAYQHADCETVYRLTQPSEIEAMEVSELRHSLRLVRGFCQELDGDQPEARKTYRRLIDDAPNSFAAADAQERLLVLDRLADDPDFATRIERVAREGMQAVAPREPDLRADALYPPLACASGVEGFAVVDFGIGRDGRTLDPVVVDSNPPFLFEGTALRAVRGWEYKTMRRADPDDRHVIRIVFQQASDIPSDIPSVAEEGAGAATGTLTETITGTATRTTISAPPP